MKTLNAIWRDSKKRIKVSRNGFLRKTEKVLKDQQKEKASK